MGFGICCHLEHPDRDVWSGTKRDVDTWRMLLRAFGGDRLAVINLTETSLPPRTEEYESFGEFRDAHPGETLVQVELGGGPLGGFHHPGDCWYVFGGTTVTLPDPDVEIERQDPRVAFHPVHAAHVVLWDRYRKGVA